MAEVGVAAKVLNVPGSVWVGCQLCSENNHFLAFTQRLLQKGKGCVHLIACDLPYGVQHAPRGASIERLMAGALPAWRESLVQGGAVAVSFNAQTLKPGDVRWRARDWNRWTTALINSFPIGWSRRSREISPWRASVESIRR